MPKKQMLKKKKGKKRPKRYQRKVNPVKSLLPARFFTKLKYVSDQIGSTTTTSMGYYQFRANSLFDPDYTGTGHQPMGFDNLAALYSDYRVNAVHIKVVGLVLTPNACGCIAIGGSAATTIHTVSSLPELLEDTAYKCRVVNDQKPIVFSRFFPIHKLMGKSKKVVQTDLDLSAGIGANPTKTVYLTVYWQNLNETTSTGWNIRAEITYYCEFNAPKPLSLS